MTTFIRAACGVAMLSVAGFATIAPAASAAPLVLASDPHPGWANPYGDSTWVSLDATGNPSNPGYGVIDDGTIVNFYDRFNVSSPGSSWLRLMADGSASVFLNAGLLFFEAPQAGHTYGTCSDYAIGCLDDSSILLNLTPLLQEGDNELLFQVAQRHGASRGLTYFDDVGQVPEPTSLILLGTGLIALGARARKRLARQRAAADAADRA